MGVFQIIPDLLHLDDSLELAREYVLGFEFNDFFTPKVLDDDKRCDELITKYKDIKVPGPVTNHGDFFDVLVFSDDEEIRKTGYKRIRQSLVVSERLGAVGTVFHSNICPQLYLPQYIDNWVDRNEECWRSICDEYPEHQIWLENMFDSDPAPMRRLAERLKDVENFGLCYDYAHAGCFGRDHDIDEWSEAVGPYVRHVHINDNDGKRDLHLPVGDGDMDWDKFLVYYDRYMKDVPVLIENTGVEAQRRSLVFLRGKGLL